MPLLEHDKAIEQYYEQVKDKYPDIDFERFRKICRSPFETIKKLIKGSTLPIIMVKHLGKFIPVKARVIQQLEYLERVYRSGKTTMTEEEYIYKKTYLENYLRDYYNETNAEIEDDMGES